MGGEKGKLLANFFAACAETSYTLIGINRIISSIKMNCQGINSRNMKTSHSRCFLGDLISVSLKIYETTVGFFKFYSQISSNRGNRFREVKGNDYE